MAVEQLLLAQHLDDLHLDLDLVLVCLTGPEAFGPDAHGHPLAFIGFQFFPVGLPCLHYKEIVIGPE